MGLSFSGILNFLFTHLYLYMTRREGGGCFYLTSLYTAVALQHLLWGCNLIFKMRANHFWRRRRIFIFTEGPWRRRALDCRLGRSKQRSCTCRRTFFLTHLSSFIFQMSYFCSFPLYFPFLLSPFCSSFVRALALSFSFTYFFVYPRTASDIELNMPQSR